MKRFLIRRWWVLLLIPLLLGLVRLRLDLNVLNLLPAEVPEVAGLQLHQRYFANSDELIITLAADDAATAEAVARQLATHLSERTNLVSRILWQPPWREHPDQLGELLGLAWLNQPPARFAELAQRLSPDSAPETLAAARQTLATSLSPEEIARASYDPFGLARLPAGLGGRELAGQEADAFVSEDGRFRLLFVNPAGALKSYRALPQWLRQIRTAVEDFRRAEGISEEVRIAFTGAPAYAAEIAAGMERDMEQSAAGTLVVIAGLFWWAHRRWRPLLWLVGLLLLVLAGTMAVGGLIFGGLNAVSLGFAAILLGLTADYALVLHQEARSRPEASWTEVRRTIGPGIVWSALTTASAFALLNFGGLPGLAQLGTLVAMGILLGAGVMLLAFLPLTLRPGSATPAKNTVPTIPADRQPSFQPGGASVATAKAPAEREVAGRPEVAAGRLETRLPRPAECLPRSAPFARVITLTTALLLAFVGGMLYWRPPVVDHSPGALALRDSEADTAMQSVRRVFGDEGEPLLLLVAGKDEREVAGRIQTLENLAQSEAGKSALGMVKVPSILWPNPDHQSTNRARALELAARKDALRETLRDAGFRDEGFALVESVLDTWARPEPLPLWPRASANVWLLEKAAARTEHGWLVSGTVRPPTNAVAALPAATALVEDALTDGVVWLTSWPALGEALLQFVEPRLWWLLAGILGLTTLCLWLAFRSAREVGLSYSALALGFGLLVAVMSLLGWTWNLMNLMAVPLLLGAGVDYGIHIQLALRRHQGDHRAVWRTTGRALALCGATTIVAFGSLAWSANAGLASLGRVCAVGIACVLLVCLFLLPAWWNVWILAARFTAPAPSRPSIFYRAEIWRCGSWLVRRLPARVTEWLAHWLGRAYCRFQSGRREVVVQNLLPVFEGHRPAAEAAARRMFTQFAAKMLDLWRLEADGNAERSPYQWSGWEHFTTAQSRGRGVLLVTAHLGNWELGGALLAARGVQLLVLTQAEPGRGFTASRQQARARHGIETLVVGEDPFAAIAIIKRLQAGGVVALLVDRPPAATAVRVELFGRPFYASVAAAELARATGCAVLPVYVARGEAGYAAHILPEISYDRAAISNRAARIALTGEILRAFEPVIRQHPEQWYHFVPIWPVSEGK